MRGLGVVVVVRRVLGWAPGYRGELRFAHGGPAPLLALIHDTHVGPGEHPRHDQEHRQQCGHEGEWTSEESHLRHCRAHGPDAVGPVAART